VKTNIKKLKVGTRGSDLALYQTRFVVSELNKHFPELEIEEIIISTSGDRDKTTALRELGGEGLFIKEIEAALLDLRIDFAVHSLKDMPVEDNDGLLTVAIPVRASWHDVFVSKDFKSLSELPPSSKVGTGSARRKSQLNWAFPGMDIVPIRGNVGTRIKRVRDGEVDGIIIAEAGLRRLGDHLVDGLFVEVLDSDVMLPAAGQGAIAVQCRRDESLVSILSVINDPEVAQVVNAERSFLSGVEGGCHTPVGALAQLKNGKVFLETVIAPDEDSFLIRLTAEQDDDETIIEMAMNLAEEAKMWLGAAVH
jgi:hydroxymethylbilane synthase